MHTVEWKTFAGKSYGSYTPKRFTKLLWNFWFSFIYFYLGETKLIYGQDSKKIGSVGRQNKNNIIWFLGSVFF